MKKISPVCTANNQNHCIIKAYITNQAFIQFYLKAVAMGEKLLYCKYGRLSQEFQDLAGFKGVFAKKESQAKSYKQSDSLATNHFLQIDT